MELNEGIALDYMDRNLRRKLLFRQLCHERQQVRQTQRQHTPPRREEGDGGHREAQPPSPEQRQLSSRRRRREQQQERARRRRHRPRRDPGESDAETSVHPLEPLEEARRHAILVSEHFYELARDLPTSRCARLLPSAQPLSPDRQASLSLSMAAHYSTPNTSVPVGTFPTSSFGLSSTSQSTSVSAVLTGNRSLVSPEGGANLNGVNSNAAPVDGENTATAFARFPSHHNSHNRNGRHANTPAPPFSDAAVRRNSSTNSLSLTPNRPILTSTQVVPPAGSRQSTPARDLAGAQAHTRVFRAVGQTRIPGNNDTPSDSHQTSVTTSPQRVGGSRFEQPSQHPTPVQGRTPSESPVRDGSGAPFRIAGRSRRQGGHSPPPSRPTAAPSRTLPPPPHGNRSTGSRPHDGAAPQRPPPPNRRGEAADTPVGHTASFAGTRAAATHPDTYALNATRHRATVVVSAESPPASPPLTGSRRSLLHYSALMDLSATMARTCPSDAASPLPSHRGRGGSMGSPHFSASLASLTNSARLYGGHYEYFPAAMGSSVCGSPVFAPPSTRRLQQKERAMAAARAIASPRCNDGPLGSGLESSSTLATQSARRHTVAVSEGVSPTLFAVHSPIERGSGSRSGEAAVGDGKEGRHGVERGRGDSLLSPPVPDTTTRMSHPTRKQPSPLTMAEILSVACSPRARDATKEPRQRKPTKKRNTLLATDVDPTVQSDAFSRRGEEEGGGTATPPDPLFSQAAPQLDVLSLLRQASTLDSTRYSTRARSFAAEHRNVESAMGSPSQDPHARRHSPKASTQAPAEKKMNRIPEVEPSAMEAGHRYSSRMSPRLVQPSHHHHHEPEPEQQTPEEDEPRQHATFTKLKGLPVVGHHHHCRTTNV